MARQLSIYDSESENNVGSTHTVSTMENIGLEAYKYTGGGSVNEALAKDLG